MMSKRDTGSSLLSEVSLTSNISNIFALAPFAGSDDFVPGISFQAQETLLGVGFVICTFGIIALTVFRNIAVSDALGQSATSRSELRRKTRAASYTLIFLGAANLAIVHVIMHALSGVVTFCEGLFWRSLACFILSVFGGLLLGVDMLINMDVFQWICLPCLLHSTATLLVFVGLSSLPTSEATALYATYPCWALLFSVCIVQEQIGPIALAGMLGTFIGIFLIIQPFPTLGNPTFDWLHISSALLTAIGAAMYGMLAITIRRMGTRVHYMVLSAWMSLYGIVLSLLVPLIQGTSPLFFSGPFATESQHSIRFVVCLVLFMVCACVSLLCQNWALQLEHSGSISMVHSRPD